MKVVGQKDGKPDWELPATPQQLSMMEVPISLHGSNSVYLGKGAPRTVCLWSLSRPLVERLTKKIQHPQAGTETAPGRVLGGPW